MDYRSYHLKKQYFSCLPEVIFVYLIYKMDWKEQLVEWREAKKQWIDTEETNNKKLEDYKKEFDEQLFKFKKKYSEYSWRLCDDSFSKLPEIEETFYRISQIVFSKIDDFS